MPREVIHAKSTKREYRKFLAVLIFIALSATLMSTLINFRPLDWIRWFVGSSLLVFGGFKLISYESFLEVFPRYDLIAHRYRVYALVYPFVQVVLGIMFILDMASGFRNVLTLAMAAVGLYGVTLALTHKGPSAHHTWLGHFLKLPMSTGFLFENLMLTLLMLILIIGSIFT